MELRKDQSSKNKEINGDAEMKVIKVKQHYLCCVRLGIIDDNEYKKKIETSAQIAASKIIDPTIQIGNKTLGTQIRDCIEAESDYLKALMDLITT